MEIRGDVSAAHGVMVSWSGFTKGAHAIAKAHGITLLSYREANAVDWNFQGWITPIIYRRDPLRCWFKTNTGDDVEVTIDEIVHVDGGNETISLRTVIEELLHIITGQHMLGQITREVSLDPPVVTSRGERLVIARIEGFVRAFAYSPIPVQFASGHVLEDAGTKLPQITSVASEGIDLLSLQETDQGHELSVDELKKLVGSNLSANTRKRYVRLCVTTTPDERQHGLASQGQKVLNT